MLRCTTTPGSEGGDGKKKPKPQQVIDDESCRQSFLEKQFPAREAPPHPKKSDDLPPKAKLSVRNTVIKVLLDQTLGAIANTLFFSVFNRSLQMAMAHAPRRQGLMKTIKFWQSPGAIEFEKVDFDQVWTKSKDELWPILQAGWMFWPVVSLFNFTMVETIQARNSVGSTAGIVWGVYMSLVAAE